MCRFRQDTPPVADAHFSRGQEMPVVSRNLIDGLDVIRFRSDRAHSTAAPSPRQSREDLLRLRQHCTAIFTATTQLFRDSQHLPADARHAAYSDASLAAKHDWSNNSLTLCRFDPASSSLNFIRDFVEQPMVYLSSPVGSWSSDGGVSDGFSERAGTTGDVSDGASEDLSGNLDSRDTQVDAENWSTFLIDQWPCLPG